MIKCKRVEIKLVRLKKRSHSKLVAVRLNTGTNWTIPGITLDRKSFITNCIAVLMLYSQKVPFTSDKRLPGRLHITP
jgi:hypothetical protein